MKDYIKNNCFTKSGGLNNRSCDEAWWSVRNVLNYYNDVMTQTSALNTYQPTFSERLYSVLNDTLDRPICQVCNENRCKFNTFKDGYFHYCSKYCSTQCSERNKKMVQNRDYDSIKSKTIKTNLERYGVKYSTQSQVMKDKSKDTKKERYGDIHYNNINKAKKTNMDRYGVEWTGQSDIIKQKIEDNRNVLYPELKDKDWLIEQNKTRSIQEIADGLNCSYRTVYLYFIKYDIEINTFYNDYSKSQNEVYDYIKSVYFDDILQNDRKVIKPKEIDIFLPKLNLGIEFNGMYWHAEDKNRHLDKYKLCKEKGITLLQIWDTEWNTRKDIVKSIINVKLGITHKIYARKCIIEELSSSEYNKFLDVNHLQGAVNSSIRFGLRCDGELVCVMGLGKSRFDKKYSHELLRFSNKLNHTVVGGFNKLLKHIISLGGIESIQTFADLRFFDGKVYEQFGFMFSHFSKPGYVYYKSNVVKNRQEFQKHKLKYILDDFDESMSEHENMNNNGWLRVYDCGQVCYTIEL